MDVHGGDLALLLGKMYGPFLILATLALVGILLLLRELPAGDRNSNKHRLLFMGPLFMLGSLYYVAFVLGIPGAEAIAADRTLLYIEVLGIALAAFARRALPHAFDDDGASRAQPARRYRLRHLCQEPASAATKRLTTRSLTLTREHRVKKMDPRSGRG